MRQGLYLPHHPGSDPIGVFASDELRVSDARIGSERLHERTLRLYARMAERDGTDLTTAMIVAQHGAQAAMRWAA